MRIQPAWLLALAAISTTACGDDSSEDTSTTTASSSSSSSGAGGQGGQGGEGGGASGDEVWAELSAPPPGHVTSLESSGEALYATFRTTPTAASGGVATYTDGAWTIIYQAAAAPLVNLSISPVGDLVTADEVSAFRIVGGAAVGRFGNMSFGESPLGVHAHDATESYLMTDTGLNSSLFSSNVYWSSFCNDSGPVLRHGDELLRVCGNEGVLAIGLPLSLANPGSWRTILAGTAVGGFHQVGGTWIASTGGGQLVPLDALGAPPPPVADVRFIKHVAGSSVDDLYLLWRATHPQETDVLHLAHRTGDRLYALDDEPGLPEAALRDLAMTSNGALYLLDEAGRVHVRKEVAPSTVDPLPLGQRSAAVELGGASVEVTSVRAVRMEIVQNSVFARIFLTVRRPEAPADAHLQLSVDVFDAEVASNTSFGNEEALDEQGRIAFLNLDRSFEAGSSPERILLDATGTLTLDPNGSNEELTVNLNIDVPVVP